MDGSVVLKKSKMVIQKVLLLFLILVVAAASFQGFFAGNVFLDKYEPDTGYRRSFVRVMDDSAHRPFIYRQLIPLVTKEISKALPETMHEKLALKLAKAEPVEKVYARAQVQQEYIVEYHIMYGLCFVCWYLAIGSIIWLIHLLCRDKAAAVLGAMAFALIFPFFSPTNGEYYDIPEVLFLSLSTCLAIKKKFLLLLFVTPFATLNKESFFWFLPALFPFLCLQDNKKQNVVVLLLCFLLSGATYLYVHTVFSGNGGGTVELHLWQHLSRLFYWKDYVNITEIYGLRFGGGMFFLHIIFVMYLLRSAWSQLGKAWKYHLAILSAVMIPLYLCFCAVGEIRNLSLYFPFFACVIGCNIHSVIGNYYLRERESSVNRERR